MKDRVFFRTSTKQWFQVYGTADEVEGLFEAIRKITEIESWQIMDNDEFERAYLINPKDVPCINEVPKCR